MRLRNSSLLQPAGQPLQWEIFSDDHGHAIEGVLRTSDPSVWYPILQGVPSFLTGPMQPDLTDFCARHGLEKPSTAPIGPEASEQAKTNKTFSDKWRRFKQYGLEPQ